MKKICYQLLITAAVALLATACKKEATLTYLDVVTFPPGLTASSNQVSLSAANSDSSVITFSWPAVTFKIQAPVTYKLQLALPADTIGTAAWSNAVNIEVGSDVLLKSFKGADLNTLATTRLGLSPDSVSTVAARVVATLDRPVYSPAVTFRIKPFKAILLNVLYVPGEYQGWRPATAKLIKEVNGRPKMYEGYVYMPGSGTKWFKYTNAPDWNHTNYGDGGNGTFSTDGLAAGLSVPDGGYYYLTANLNTNTWTATKTTWSIIGDATPGGWGTDTQMTYDEAAQVWKVTVDMKAAGSFKFRANNAWVLDFGIDGATKELKYADNPFLGYTPDLWNLSVPQDGNYTITLDLHNPGAYSYTLHKN